MNFRGELNVFANLRGEGNVNFSEKYRGEWKEKGKFTVGEAKNWKIVVND